ncbi:MAG: helix-turn-helix transcriptional regulator [Lachnospiraceae bacterium]|jgi:transcriptional regulator with XRE-family HTH domain|nr:helix-turn-helix transcriptional regulator [Lachnospiraceae bacterium]MCI8874150.1 helix-turn-helix transcriptional regulator [Lachnospiraceae bacterium]MCI9059799.1 helix-turn-helix transcriptional regulator [Lachnospiraceae bacterium]GFI32285.1 hypothetical protein IMSAGC013_03684 [Lachnospiraceae bacterium]
MKNPNIAKVLKAYRKLNHFSINDLVMKLEDYKLPVAPKTIYGWESGQTQPDADTLLVLCKIYNIENILGTFGYSDSWDDFFLTEEERSLVLHYRKTPDMKPAVRKLLDME